jgi:hypothetical protein
MAPHDETTINPNHQCIHAWAPFVPAPGEAKYHERCANCGARCSRDASAKIVEYDRGVKVSDHHGKDGAR